MQCRCADQVGDAHLVEDYNVSDPEYPWHSIHFRTPRRLRSRSRVRRPRTSAPLTNWLFQPIDSVERCTQYGNDCLDQALEATNSCKANKPGWQGAASCIDGIAQPSKLECKLLSGLPFSKAELMQMLSDFLCRRNLSRQDMTRRHVSLFKAAVQNAANTRVELSDAPSNRCDECEVATLLDSHSRFDM